MNDILHSVGRFPVRLRLAFLIAFLLAPLAASAVEPLLVDDFATGLRPGWAEKAFRGRTRYVPATEDGRPALKAESRAAASGLYFPIRVNPVVHPRIAWSWKVARSLSPGDERTKGGDDYAARVYVVFPSRLFWRTRAINYVWAGRMPVGSSWPNAFTENARMIAVESGDAKAGRWVDEERDLRADFLRAFGEEPPEAGAVAIMTDTDNAGGGATAWYGAIRLLPAK
jgi:hypothetical protein